MNLDYGKIYSLGSNIISGPQGILIGNVTVEEKVDGSQITFGFVNGELLIKSKDNILDLNNPPKMFNQAVNSIKNISHILRKDFLYRGEYLSKPKHNVLAYDRLPKNNIILFDINIAENSFLSYEAKKVEADRIGLEVVPLLYKGSGENLNENLFKEFLNTDSILGSKKIEGFVIKNYEKLSKDNKIMMAKFVSDSFKETQHKKPVVSKKDVLVSLIEEYKTEARWNKAIQHLREKDLLKDEASDIGILIKEISQDFTEECKEEIKDKLWDHFHKNISNGILEGFALYYKAKLLENSLTVENEVGSVEKQSEE